LNAAERRAYEAVTRRADGVCECCFGPALPGHRDHFHGRRNGTTTEGMWLLCWECDLKKTNNEPDAATWVRRFMTHCALYGYAAEIAQCETRLAVIAAKGR
jgi:hypothetical protein